MNVLDGSRGRPTKLNLSTLRRIVEAIELGAQLSTAARSAGIGDQTRLDWMRRGRSEFVRVQDEGFEVEELIDATSDDWPSQDDWSAPGEPFEPREWPFLVFSVAAEKAEARAELRALAVIRNAMPNHWQAAAWSLERRYPQRYGRREFVQELRRAEEVVVSVADLERKFLEIVDLLPPEP